MRKLLLFLIVLLCAGVARQARATDSMTLSALSPASNATNQPDGSAAYPLTISMTITGSSSIDNAFSPPVIGTNILLSSTACTSPTSVTATGSVSYSSCSGIPSHCKVASVSMSPSSTLSGNTKYYICVLNGSAYINDTGGTKLASSSTYFTTRDNTPPDREHLVLVRGADLVEPYAYPDHHLLRKPARLERQHHERFAS